MLHPHHVSVGKIVYATIKKNHAVQRPKLELSISLYNFNRLWYILLDDHVRLLLDDHVS
jgi:hypothetical protein